MVVAYSAAFKRQLKRLSHRYRRIRDDVQPLIDRLLAGETPGERVQIPDHVLYKVRLRNRDAARGTRGGYRVIYYLATGSDVLLVTIYSKSEQSDISPSEILQVIRVQEP
jgi:mRNA-degrading endonuclease RelE of RelBE toxin-antitoxin system